MVSGDNNPFLCGETEMSTDPKKSDEMKDEELENVSGGIEEATPEREDGGEVSKGPVRRPKD